MRILDYATIKSVAGYKSCISTLLPHACRFSPTCSEYTAAVILKYGFFSGLTRALFRLGRCHPFAARGIDMP